MAGKSKKKAQKIASAVTVFAVALTAALVTHFTDLGDSLKQTAGLSKGEASSADLSVHFIDVGQGDCTLIMCEGHNMLIDAGESDQGSTVLEYLNAQGVTKLDYVIGTHPHSDHIGGLRTIVESDIEIGKFIMPKVPDDMVPTSYTYTKLLKAVVNKGMTVTQADDITFDLGSASVNTYTPKNTYSNLNDYSVVSRITHGDNSFLITGDLSKNSESELIDRGCDLSADVLQVGHHGSKESSTKKFLNKVNPLYAVIQCGAGNSYGHPHDEALERIKKFTDRIYISYTYGTIVFESDKTGINIKTENQES